MRYQLSIIEVSKNKFVFRGSVPKDLAILHEDWTPLTNKEFAEYKRASLPGLLKRANNYIEPIFESKEKALAYAEKFGVTLEEL